jgi:hypothetical protein
MKKTDWQYLVDTLLFICMIGIAFIGILMGFFLATGPSVSESEKYFLGLHRHQWGDIHLYLSLAFILLIILHLALAWNWIKGKSQALFKQRWRTSIALTVFGSILVVFLFWVFTPKYSQFYEDYGRGGRTGIQDQFQPENFIDQEEGYLTITGNMTLAEVERIAGIPSEVLVQELGLPERTSSDETLGQLRKKYGFSVVEARDAITALLQSTPDEASEPKAFEGQARTPQRTHEEIEAHEHEDEPKVTRGRLSEDRSGILITGQTTLYELAKQTGLSVRQIARALGLPGRISADQSLGRLRRRYGFTMQDVRDAITALLEKSDPNGS